MEENFSMEWNMEENFSMEWNMEWKIFAIKWKRNGRLPVWNMEKSSSIPYHALLAIEKQISAKQNKVTTDDNYTNAAKYCRFKPT